MGSRPLAFHSNDPRRKVFPFHFSLLILLLVSFGPSLARTRRRERETKLAKGFGKEMGTVTTNLCPKSGMDNVEAFQILFVLVLEDVVDFAHPRHRWMVMSFRQRVEVQNNVIRLDKRLQ